MTPKFGVSFQLDDSNLFYANAAKGVRGRSVAEPVGAACNDDAATLGFDPLSPRQIDADSLWSYELGSKNKLLGGRMAVDASVYHTDWDNVQTNLLLPQCSVLTTLNLGNVQIDGVDLSLTVVPIGGLTLGASASYTDARYTSALKFGDTVIRRKGEPLDVAPLTMSFNSEYSFSLMQRDAYVRADYTRNTRDNTPLDVTSPLVDPDLPRAPATSVLDLRAGLRFGDTDVSLFVKNVLNDSPLLSLGHDDVGSGFFRSTTYRPRTIGITATFRL